MSTERTVAGLRAAVAEARESAHGVALVPTMGFLHEGHLSLMGRARSECSFVVASLFVNPAQFVPGEDFESYPRDERRDAALAAETGVDLLFAPPPAEVYPEGFATAVEVEGLTDVLCGAPGSRGRAHFRGVATVVTKLLNMAQPDDAYFGQKDAQQALIIRRLVRDLDIPTHIEICPTVREPDGLAMSSRNVRLDPDTRRRAPALFRALRAVEAAVAEGGHDAGRSLAAGEAILAEAGIVPEYFAAVSADTLEPVARITDATLVAVAANLGGVRLIDNVLVHPGSHER